MNLAKLCLMLKGITVRNNNGEQNASWDFFNLYLRFIVVFSISLTPCVVDKGFLFLNQQTIRGQTGNSDKALLGSLLQQGRVRTNNRSPCLLAPEEEMNFSYVCSKGKGAQEPPLEG